MLNSTRSQMDLLQNPSLLSCKIEMQLFIDYYFTETPQLRLCACNFIMTSSPSSYLLRL